MKKNYATLQSVIDWAKQKNIQLIFLTAPAFKTYREALNAEQLNSTSQAVNELAAKNDHCQYFNLLSDTTFTEPDFFDADHLDETGSKKLSLMLNEKINAIQKRK